MVKKVSLYEVFSDLEEDYVEGIGMFDIEDVEGVTNYDVNNYDSEPWYHYFKVDFDYKGNRYVFKYREHASDNVTDRDFIEDSLVLMGKVEDLEEVITGEDLAEQELMYLERIDRLKTNQEKLEEERQQLKDIKRLFRRISTENLGVLVKVYGQHDESNLSKELANAFKGLAEMKKYGKL